MREGVEERVGRLALLLGAVIATGPLAIDMYLPAMPTLQVEFNADVAHIQYTLSAYLLGGAIGQLFYGPLADRYGRKPPLIFGLALYALGAVGCALAWSAGSLAALRFLQALGGAAGMVVIRAVIRDRFDALQSARMLSLMMLVMGVAPICAPLFGGWILLHGSWRAIFWFLAVYGALCVVATGYFLAESHPPERRGGSLGQAFAAFPGVLRDIRFLGPTLAFCFAFGSLFAYLASAPFVFIQHFGIPAHEFGWYFGAVALGLISMSQANRKLVQRLGPRAVLGWGIQLSAASAAVMLWFAVSGASLPWVYVPLLFLAASFGLIAPNAAAVAMAPFGKQAGAASSLIGVMQFIVAIIAIAAVGWIQASGAVPMAAIMTICSALALASFILLTRS